MSFDWGSFVGGIVGGGLSGVVTLVAAFRIANTQTRAREQSAKKHLEILLRRASAIPSPKNAFLPFAQAHDAAVKLASIVRESVMATQDVALIDATHTLLMCLDSISTARKSMTATLDGFVDNDGGKATASLEAARETLRGLTIPS